MRDVPDADGVDGVGPEGSDRGVHRTRTSRAGRVRTTVAVPVLFQAWVNHLDGRWTGRSRSVQDRHGTSVTAVKTVGRASPNFFRVNNFAFFVVVPGCRQEIRYQDSLLGLHVVAVSVNLKVWPPFPLLLGMVVLF
jgi:hypothetical protein